MKDKQTARRPPAGSGIDVPTPRAVRTADSQEYVGSTVVLVVLLLLLFKRACLSLPGAEIVVILVVSERMSNRIFTSGSRHHERASIEDEQPEYQTLLDEEGELAARRPPTSTNLDQHDQCVTRTDA